MKENYADVEDIDFNSEYALYEDFVISLRCYFWIGAFETRWPESSTSRKLAFSLDQSPAFFAQ